MFPLTLIIVYRGMFVLQPVGRYLHKLFVHDSV